jgi:hypothetical protein
VCVCVCVSCITYIQSLGLKGVRKGTEQNSGYSERTGVRIISGARDISFLQKNVQAGCMVHPFSYSMSTGGKVIRG